MIFHFGFFYPFILWLQICLAAEYRACKNEKWRALLSRRHCNFQGEKNESVLKYDLTGVSYDRLRDSKLHLSTNRILTKLVHSFSEGLEKRIWKEFFIPERQEDRSRREMHLLSPGLQRQKNGSIAVVLRIWLHAAFENYKYHNYFAENYLFMQYLEPDFKREIRASTIVPIIAPMQFSSGVGPSDPRLFTLGDSLFMSFYLLRDNGTGYGRILLRDVTSGRIFQPTVANFEPGRIESNWIPFDLGGQLYYVYLINPLRVIKCDIGSHLPSAEAPCRFVFEGPRGTLLSSTGSPNVRDLAVPPTLRGGTPLVLYKSLSLNSTNVVHFYLTAVHSTILVKDNVYKMKRSYAAHFALMQVIANSNNDTLLSMCIVYLSKKLMVNKEVFESVRLVLWDEITDHFIFPVGLVLENDNCALVSYHASDDKSFISRFCGLRDLLMPLVSLQTKCLSEALSPEQLNSYMLKNLL